MRMMVLVVLLATVATGWAEQRTSTCQYQMLPGQWKVISVTDFRINYRSNPACYDSDSECNYFPDYAELGSVENPLQAPTCTCYAAKRRRCVSTSASGYKHPYNNCTATADCGLSPKGEPLVCEDYTYLPLCKTKYVWTADGTLEGVFCRSTLPLSGYGDGVPPKTTTTTTLPAK